MAGAEEGYDGPAQLVTRAGSIRIEVALRGAFQPIDGRYHWYGRLARDHLIDEACASGSTVVVATPHGRASGTLSDVDSWGRYRIAGVGRPPFPVPTGD